MWYILCKHHHIEMVDQFLGPPHRERRDDNLATALERSGDNFSKFIECNPWVIMCFIAVGTFHNHVIDISGQNGVAQQRNIISPNIAREPRSEERRVGKE